MATATGWSTEVIPPAPPHYFNDYAGVVPEAVATGLDRQLEQFERETSDQVVVAVFSKMQSDSSLEDYTHRVMESWKVGQRIKNNGVGLFVFVANHTTRIEVNYGLEGVLSDAISKRIIEDEMLPHFRANDYAGGLTAGLTAIQQAIRGEYRGSGKTTADDKMSGWSSGWFVIGLLFLVGFGFLRSRVWSGGTVYGRTGRGLYTAGLLFSLFGGGSGRGGSGGGGGFSGGGGSGGGGGASGRW